MQTRQKRLDLIGIIVRLRVRDQRAQIVALRVRFDGVQDMPDADVIIDRKKHCFDRFHRKIVIGALRKIDRKLACRDLNALLSHQDLLSLLDAERVQFLDRRDNRRERLETVSVGQNRDHADRGIAIDRVGIDGVDRSGVVSHPKICMQASADFSGCFHHEAWTYRTAVSRVYTWFVCLYILLRSLHFVKHARGQ